MELDKIIYSLNIADLQQVAEEELGRRLTLDEINRVKDKVGERIDWFQAIGDTLSEAL